MKDLSEIIKMQRNLKKLTQAELAEFAEINVNTIVKIEKDVNKTSIETLRKVLDVLDMDLAVIPKIDSKTKFMDLYYPHLREEGISTYLLRIISEIERQRSMKGSTKKKDTVKIDFMKLIVRMYDTKLKTEEGQMFFYRALKNLSDVTKKMSDEHVLLWYVESMDMTEDCIIFNCEKKTHKKMNIQPLPSFLLPVNDMNPKKSFAAVKSIDVFIKNLTPINKIRLKDIFEIEDENERKDTLADFLQNKGLDEEAIETMIHTLNKHDINVLLN